MFKRDDKDEEKLKKLKKCVENSYQYFLPNVERYNEFMRFVFKTSLNTDDLTKLDVLQKPPLEFNILEAMISRQRGEFAKHEPSITVSATEDIRPDQLTDSFIATIKAVEEHFRVILNDTANDNLDYDTFTKTSGGGFAVLEVYTDYINAMSFDQKIGVRAAFDPTLTGFDPLARESHKGDGDYCFKLTPKSKEEMEEEYGEDVTRDMNFTRNSAMNSFNWSFQNQDRKILLLCEFFYKVRKRERLIKLSNGHTMLKKHYDRFMELWNKQGFIEQAPIIIGDARTTLIESVERMIFCENKIISHDKTCFTMFPLVFVDGNSVNVRDTQGTSAIQVTRPAVYHAQGIQKLLNFSGQTIAAEIENMTQHKMVVAAESIPKDYVDAYKNVQVPSNYVYNAFYEGKPDQPLPPPREVMRPPTPPIVENIFNGSSNMVQTILGSYDGILGINDKQISGVAIQQGAMQSNAAAMPYLVSFVKGQNRVAQIILDLIPKFYVTPRSIPVMKADGKRSYQIINDPSDESSVDMKYDSNSLQIKIESGVSSAVQKQVALDQIARMMQTSEIFAKFINRDCLETIIDNLDIRGVDVMKAQAVKFMEELKQAEQQPPPPDPMVQAQQEQVQAYHEVEMAKVEQMAHKNEGEMAIQSAKVANEKQALEIKYLEVMAKLHMEDKKVSMELDKQDSENAREAVEAAIKLSSHMREGHEI